MQLLVVSTSTGACETVEAIIVLVMVEGGAKGGVGDIGFAFLKDSSFILEHVDILLLKLACRCRTL